MGTWYDGAANTSYGAADNPVQRGEDAMWRVQREFVYRSRIKSSINGNKIYDNAGVFMDDQGNVANAFKLYDWRVDDENDQAKWLNASTVTQYAPTGEAVEEHDILSIYSAARFAHENTVPKLVAANAEYESVNFEGFEERKTWGGNADVIDEFAHSGAASYQLDPSGAWSGSLTAVDINQHIVDSGLIVKIWVKRSYDDPGSDPEDGATPYTPVRIKIGGHTYSTPSTGAYGTLEENVIHKVAQTGEWIQYQLLARDFLPTELQNEEEVSNDLPILIKQNLDNSFNLWIDDIRVQPYDAQMICYVYDRDNLRLLTTFDDQHFGAYYQYNGEGKLVRTLRETERGLKTLAETQYHSTEIKRYDFTPAGPAASISPGFPDISNLSGNGSLASGSEIRADLMNLRIGPEGPTFDFFKSREGALPDLNAFKSLDLQKKLTERIALPEVEALKYLNELREIEKEIESVNEQIDDGVSDELNDQLETRRKELNERRRKLIEEKLGISEDDWTSWYQEMRTSEKNSSSIDEE